MNIWVANRPNSLIEEHSLVTHRFLYFTNTPLGYDYDKRYCPRVKSLDFNRFESIAG